MKFKVIITLIILSLYVFGCNFYPSTPVSTPSDTNYIENKGSDTMVNLALAWAEEYQNIRPDIRVAVSGGGSGTGIAALINGTVDLANASRQITVEEISAARSRGYDPVEFVVARDAIAVIVHPDNPIDTLTLAQLSDIYSGKIKNWLELGGEDRPIVRLSRETNSGTHIFFLEEVLRLGDPDNRTLFSTDTLLLPSSQGITQEVSDNRNAIGYEGLGYVVPEVKVLAVASTANDIPFMPTLETVLTASYPISRDL
ncbi:MAG: phosphate ABC transporter substrate-binding protein, partial [Anaerolineales bacterium]